MISQAATVYAESDCCTIPQVRRQEETRGKISPIEAEDMMRIRASFSRSTPAELQDEFLFNCLYYFGLRGRETLRYLTRDSFEIKTDSYGRRYLYLSGDRLSKNCRASLSPKDFEDAKKVRAYECSERPMECPVKCLETYLSKLPQSTMALFPKPLSMPKNDVWYCEKKELGKNTLGGLLAKLSKTLNLKKRYTNHCVRVTTVQVLSEQGFNNESIAMVTGHKNANSVQRYLKKRRDDSFYFPSEALQAGSSATVSRKVVPVGNGTGKIIVTEETPAETSVDVDSKCSKASIQFSGQFQNCIFNVN
jgi:integrase